MIELFRKDFIRFDLIYFLWTKKMNLDEFMAYVQCNNKIKIKLFF